jgi:hypothetical protein
VVHIGTVCRHPLFLAQKFYVCGHPWQHAVRRVIDANFHAENLVHSFFARLYVARQEFRLLVDLFDRATENLLARGINGDLGFLADVYAVNFSFGDIDANVNLIALE